jgi:4'-phosphopantetheinyl transferase
MGASHLVDLPSMLARGEVHVVCADLSSVADALIQRGIPLSAAERERARCFRLAERRLVFEWRRRLLKLLLARYLRIPATSVELETGVFGKPRVARDDVATRGSIGSHTQHVSSGHLPVACACATGQPSRALIGDLQFSVSRSGDRVMFAFTQDRQIGIDLEAIRDDIDPMEIATRFFSAPEQQFLEKLPEQQRAVAFYRIWTRKEAYVKALGGGLRIPLDSFAVSTAKAGGPALTWSADEGAADRWWLFPVEPFPGHVGAVIVERPSTQPKIINLGGIEAL